MSEADPDGIEEQFAEIAERLEADTGAIRTVDIGFVPGVMPEMRLSLEILRQKLMDSLVDNLIDIGDIDTSDDEELGAAVDIVTEGINKEFEDMPELEFGDVVVASGQTVIMLVDPSDGELCACSIDNMQGVIGQVMSLGVIEIPDISAIKDMNDGVEFDLDTNPVPLNPFGLGLVLANARPLAEEESEWFEAGYIVAIPLNYPQLVLEKMILPAQD